MITQPEQALENDLMTQLEGMGYERVAIKGEGELLGNLRGQLERHNEGVLKGNGLSEGEFERVLNYLSKGSVWEKAHALRGTMRLVRDDNTSAYIQFFNSKEWCQNQFQVTNQVTVQGSYKNRYDVTILINGLPLVQIELKRRGLELKEAFNQTNRYQRHSYDASYGLFQYVQFFVISNGVNTKYYANNRNQSFKLTSFWADADNNKITQLDEFTKVFLDKCHAAKMIARYTVLKVDKTAVMLRPYQYYAVEKIINRVETTNKNGYIWHTTGSGKTLTSFKASQLLMDLPEVHKVVFVVDRNDLDTQTIREFNSFKEGSVDGTDSTNQLVSQFADPSTKLIVTTIQKLNTAITRDRHLSKMDAIGDKKIVFIFDECHRSQFGETHKRITDYFENHQMIGFTGTPIFADNATGNGLGKRTTEQLFHDCLHKYVITDAIRDENVLKFAVEYVGKYRVKDGSANNVDIDVEAIDVKELMESPKRLEKITDYIIANHDRKTHAREFTGMFCVSNVDTLTKYYDLFKTKQQAGLHNLKVATIFSYQANADDKDADGMSADETEFNAAPKAINMHSRDKLESYIADYNRQFGTNFTTRDSTSFYNYYRDIATRVRNREIDILLVVNMFLTGFDSKPLNTLYVDKNLRYHGLLQAYSRTNRILNEQKSQGNIVVFRNLKSATDDAIALFSNKDASGVIFTSTYEEYLQSFNTAVEALLSLTPNPSDVDNMMGEAEELEFVKAFREVMRLRNILMSFADFNYPDTSLTAQQFEDFKSKYLDIYDKVRSNTEPEKVSILEDVDFELELIRRDDIDVDYIIRVLTNLVGANEEQTAKAVGNISTVLSGDTKLRSKKELIEKFITNNIPKIKDKQAVEGEFDAFWSSEKLKAFDEMCQNEKLNPVKFQKLIDDYMYTGRKPHGGDIAEAFIEKPKVLERETILGRIGKNISAFIETFLEGM
jgi:type I restriction enzyme, R subunit